MNNERQILAKCRDDLRGIADKLDEQKREALQIAQAYEHALRMPLDQAIDAVNPLPERTAIVFEAVYQLGRKLTGPT